MDGGDAGRLLHLLVGGGGVHDADVIPYGAGVEEGLLQHDADAPAKAGVVDVVDVHAADGDLTPCAGVEPLQKLHQAALAGARGPQDGHRLPGLHGEGDVLQHVVRGVVAEAYVVEADVTGHVHGEGLARLLLRLRVHDLGEPLQGDGGFAHVSQDTAQLPRGPGEHGGVGGEEGHEAQRHSALGAEIDARRQGDADLSEAHGVRQAPVVAQQPVEPDVSVPGLGVQLRQLLILRPLLAEGPDDAHARQILLQGGGQLSLRFVRVLEIFLHVAEVNEGGYGKQG